MNLNHHKILERDFKERKNLFSRALILGKLTYYFFQRPIASFVLRKFLKKRLSKDKVFTQIDEFLLNNGGMFKRYVYKICDRFYPLKDSTILVPGIGYGKNLFQLASFQPKIIVAFDLYKYQGEWEFLSKKILEKFGVKVLFFEGDFNILPQNYLGFFDFIITDAVLEHVRNLSNFVRKSKNFLRDGGIFYASFGPLWYGPSGDHIYWGRERIFNHLILSKRAYEQNLEKRFSKSETDLMEGAFMVKSNFFSYLPSQKYFEILSQAGFKKLFSFANISTEAISLLKRKPEMDKLLNKKGVPHFDRYCGGLYLWMKLDK